MYDVVVFAEKSADAAARTLTSLVEGVVTDIIKRVIVVVPEEHPELLALANAAGCQIITIPGGSENTAVLDQALTTDHTLCLNAGAELPQGWPDLLKAEFAYRGVPESAVTVMFKPSTTVEWFKLVMHHSIKGNFPLNYGALVPRKILINSDLDGKIVKSKILPVHMSHLKVRFQPS